MKARLLAAALAAALALGCAQAPFVPDGQAYELSLPDLDGQPASLWSYRGKVVFLTFFATWCLPCLGEIPLLDELQKRRGAEGLQVVAVGLDRERELVLRPFRDYYKVSYPILVGGERFADPGLPFAPIHTLPTTFVISREGKVLARWEGPMPRAELDQVAGLALKAE
jgi:thiol-disulfide isomerase/thioredoxin